jgi:hypothetical protein
VGGAPLRRDSPLSALLAEEHALAVLVVVLKGGRAEDVGVADGGGRPAGEPRAIHHRGDGGPADFHLRLWQRAQHVVLGAVALQQVQEFPRQGRFRSRRPRTHAAESLGPGRSRESSASAVSRAFFCRLINPKYK